jgi:hypothetical protein
MHDGGRSAYKLWVLQETRKKDPEFDGLVPVEMNTELPLGNLL